MSITTIRLALVEQAVAKLVVAKGPRVSEFMRRARASAVAGEAVPVQVYDVGELEQQAARGGLMGQLAQSRLRMHRGFAPEALSVARV